MNQKVFQKRRNQAKLPSIKQNNGLNGNYQQVQQHYLVEKRQKINNNNKYQLQQSQKIENINELLDKSIDNPSSFQSENRFNLNTDIIFEAKILYSQIDFPYSDSKQVPAMISLEAKDVIQGTKLGMDIICVVDISQKMAGKFDVLKDSLKILIDYMQPNDRLSVILFNSEVEVLFKLKKMKKEKKNEMKQKIDDIPFFGNTDIASALELAFQLLRDRKRANPATAVFLLTGGQDVQSYEAIDQVFLNIDFPYVLHTFGFGNDHDIDFLMKLNKISNGNFYYIPSVEIAGQAFMNAIGGLKSIVGQQIQIKIQCSPLAPFDQIHISDIYGQKWEEKVQGRNYTIQLPILSVGQRKNFVFNLSIPNYYAKHNVMNNIFPACIAILKIQCPLSKRIFTHVCSLKVNLILGWINNCITNLDVQVQWLRVQTAQIIEKARQSCQNNDYFLKYELQSTIVDFSKQINFIQQTNWIPFFIEELKQAKQVMEQKSYQSYGKILMMQMVLNNYNQNGITVRFESQQNSPQAVFYQYSQSQSLVSQVLLSRQTSCTDDQFDL